MEMTNTLPPDPEGMNDARARSADAAIRTFMDETGTDCETALLDLLVDLQHWADRHNFDFPIVVQQARKNYWEEIGGKPRWEK
jgi:hypothetical protein